MNCDSHWHHLSRKLCSNLFLFKQMKMLGFNIEQIVTTYKSLSLSLVDYAAPLLTSAPSTVENALKRCHKRFLRIINCLDDDDALAKYNLLPIDQHIDERCKSILERILKDRSHPTTTKLSKANFHERSIQTRASFQFEAPIPKHERYNKSFVPKTLRAIRDNIATKPSTSGPAPTAENTTAANPAPAISACPYCHRTYKTRGLKTHIRHCKSKNSDHNQ